MTIASLMVDIGANTLQLQKDVQKINGHLDELLYERGTFVTNLPFAELKKTSNINARAKAADQAPDFSQQIRQGLPGFDE